MEKYGGYDCILWLVNNIKHVEKSFTKYIEPNREYSRLVMMLYCRNKEQS